MNIEINPEFKALLPPLPPEEYRQLEKNIIADGCREPLVVFNNTLVDGHNRYEICTKHGFNITVNNSLSPFDIQKRRKKPDVSGNPANGDSSPFDDNIDF